MLKQNKALLIMLHCQQHTGYAIATLEKVFLQAAITAGYLEENIYWSFQKIESDASGHVIECDYRSPSDSFINFLSDKKINTVLAFDLNYPNSLIKILKEADVRTIISYWGAAISSINHGPKLWMKRIEWYIRRNKPNYFIFESEAMRQTATKGRGIPESRTIVIHLGVDTELFFPSKLRHTYAHDMFDIPSHRKIVFYSGHMEERKGVKTIINAAIDLIENRKIDDVHFLLCGNRDGEASTYLQMLAGKKAADHVTFGGYRTDMPELMRTCYLGVIASTGWDSFTMSSVEMMASGLPLIVSRLQGLSETIDNGKNGLYIKPGDHLDLSKKIAYMVRNPLIAEQFALVSRARAVNSFSVQLQSKKIADVLQNMTSGS